MRTLIQHNLFTVIVDWASITISLQLALSELSDNLRLVFISNRVVVGVAIRSIKRCNLVKIYRVGSRTLILLMTIAYNLLKTRLSESKQKCENKPITMFDSRPSDWLVLPLLLSTLTIQFSLNHKQQSRKQNQKYILILPTPILTPTPSLENQPLIYLAQVKFFEKE